MSEEEFSQHINLLKSEEVENEETAAEFRKCNLCGDKITPTQERVRPCGCETLEVHYVCAVNDKKWLSRKCTTCGEIWQMPPSSSSFERTPSAVDTDERTQVCSICGSSSIFSKSGLRLDAKMIRPCFCDTSCHHGCLVDRLQLSRLCKVCGVSYRYQEYGSLRDFFVRYWCQYSCSLVFLLILFGLAAIVIMQTLKDVQVFSLGKLFVLIIGVAIFGVCLIFLWMCVKYTVMRRIPRFHARYRQITIFDYEPSSCNVIQMRHDYPGRSKDMALVHGGNICLGKCLPGTDLCTTQQVSNTSDNDKRPIASS